MSSVFADTFFWYGLTNPKDQWHAHVLRSRSEIAGRQIVTTDEVLIEFASAMASDMFLRMAAKTLIDAILTDPSVTVITQSRGSFIAGLELYGNRPDKAYSLVDCISMTCCRNLGITEILTNDRHFLQEGFAVLIQK